jgi:hypothetical protein
MVFLFLYSPYPTVNGVIAYRAILILESDSSPCRLDIVEEVGLPFFYSLLIHAQIEEDMEQIKQKSKLHSYSSTQFNLIRSAASGKYAQETHTSWIR